jgi:mRNA interferase MazF
MDLTLKRGDIVICKLSGDFGKPRPAVIVQSDLFNATHSSVTVCPITSHLVDAALFRLPVSPSSKNGLKKISHIMMDKITTLRREKLVNKIGVISQQQLASLTRALKTWLSILE